MTPSKSPKAHQAANLPLDARTDADSGLAQFSATWPFEPVDFRRAAAKAEFMQLTAAEREAAIRCAPSFIKAWRSACRGPLPSARKWLRERGWESVRAAAESAASATTAECLPDGRWRLHPSSLQLQRWREHERRTFGRARLGLMRTSEWPPNMASTCGASDRSPRGVAIVVGERRP